METNNIAGIKTINEIGEHVACNGWRSGYVTHDFNDNGLKAGCLTVVTGKTGSGKTSWTRQILLSVIRQHVNSFMFIGESSLAKEKNRLVRLIAKPEEVVCKYGLAGVRIYTPCKEAITRFEESFKPYLYLTDMTAIKESTTNQTIFGRIFIAMKKLLAEQNVKFFILDNLMMLCEKRGNAIFDEQKEITKILKNFVNETGTHVILIAHTKKGAGSQDISGATELTNICDTILRYSRIRDEDKASLIKVNPDKKDFFKRISACVTVEKIRDDGRENISWIEWEPERGILFDVSELKSAAEYEQQGYWTKSVNQSKIPDIYY